MLAGLGFVVVYQLQDFSFLNALKRISGNHELPLFVKEGHPTFSYVFNKTIRYLINDLLAIALIQALFNNLAYTRFAVYVMLFGLFILLPLYFILFFNFYTKIQSLLFYFHRLIVNPVLVMLLIPAFYYQRRPENATH